MACDLQPFTAWPRVVNPALRFLTLTLGWRADLQIPAEVRSIFGNVDVATFSPGSLFIAVARRAPDRNPS